MSHTSVRTQIYLPRELRKEIDRLRAISGESLAEYIRKATKARIKEDSEGKDLKRLADRITSGVNKSGWDGMNVSEWQREIRQDRDLDVHP